MPGTSRRNKEQDDRLIELIDAFAEFRETYETDMRGDKKLNGGARGVIGEIRELKDMWQKYPSLTWLFAHRTLPTIISGIMIFVFLTGLYTVGLLRLMAAMFGMDVPLF